MELTDSSRHQIEIKTHVAFVLLMELNYVQFKRTIRHGIRNASIECNWCFSKIDLYNRNLNSELYVRSNMKHISL